MQVHQQGQQRVQAKLDLLKASQHAAQQRLRTLEDENLVWKTRYEQLESHADVQQQQLREKLAVLEAHSQEQDRALRTAESVSWARF